MEKNEVLVLGIYLSYLSHLSIQVLQATAKVKNAEVDRRTLGHITQGVEDWNDISKVS